MESDKLARRETYTVVNIPLLGSLVGRLSDEIFKFSAANSGLRAFAHMLARARARNSGSAQITSAFRISSTA